MNPQVLPGQDRAGDFRREGAPPEPGADPVEESVRRYAASLSAQRETRIEEAVLAAMKEDAPPLPAPRVRAGRFPPWPWPAAAAAGFLLWFAGPALRNRIRSGAAPEAGAVAWVQSGLDAETAGAAAGPIVRQSHVIAFQRSGANRLCLTAFDRETGAVLWQSAAPVPGAMTADEDRVYILEADPGRRLVAVRVCDGAEMWAIERETAARPGDLSAVLLAGDALIWTEADRVHSADRNTGRLRWVARTGHGDPRAMASGPDGRVYVASLSAVSALDGARGTTAWTKPHAVEGVTAVWLETAGDGVLVACGHGARRGALRAHEARSGAVRWERVTGFPLSLSVQQGRVFLRTGEVHVFAARTGESLWSVPLPGCGPATESEGIVYLAGGRSIPALFAYESERGVLLWQAAVSGSCGGMVPDGAWGFIRSRRGELYALRLNRRG